jgi:hypothetical protein
MDMHWVLYGDESGERKIETGKGFSCYGFIAVRALDVDSVSRYLRTLGKSVQMHFRSLEMVVDVLDKFNCFGTVTQLNVGSEQSLPLGQYWKGLEQEEDSDGTSGNLIWAELLALAVQHSVTGLAENGCPATSIKVRALKYSLPSGVEERITETLTFKLNRVIANLWPYLSAGSNPLVLANIPRVESFQIGDPLRGESAYELFQLADHMARLARQRLARCGIESMQWLAPRIVCEDIGPVLLNLIK